MSGGEGQELIAFILGAALRYRLGEGGQAPPTYGCVVLDEGFVNTASTTSAITYLDGEQGILRYQL